MQLVDSNKIYKVLLLNENDKFYTDLCWSVY